MKRLMVVVFLAAAVIMLLADTALAAGSLTSDDAQQTQLQDRTCAQVCDPARDCDGNQMQQRPRTRQDWPSDDEAELENAPLDVGTLSGQKEFAEVLKGRVCSGS